MIKLAAFGCFITLVAHCMSIALVYDSLQADWLSREMRTQLPDIPMRSCVPPSPASPNQLHSGRAIVSSCDSKCSLYRPDCKSVIKSLCMPIIQNLDTILLSMSWLWTFLGTFSKTSWLPSSLNPCDPLYLFWASKKLSIPAALFFFPCRRVLPISLNPIILNP